MECLPFQWIPSQLSLSGPLGDMRKYNPGEIWGLLGADTLPLKGYFAKCSHHVFKNLPEWKMTWRVFVKKPRYCMLGDTQCLKCSKCKSPLEVYFCFVFLFLLYWLTKFIKSNLSFCCGMKLLRTIKITEQDIEMSMLKYKFVNMSFPQRHQNANQLGLVHNEKPHACSND